METLPLKFIMLLILIITTAERKQSCYIYMEHFTSRNKTLSKTTNIQQVDYRPTCQKPGLVLHKIYFVYFSEFLFST